MTISVSFALTGFIGSQMGIIQALLGFATKKIIDIGTAVTFIISSCFVALLGIMLVGGPLEVRLVKTGKIEKPSLLSRISWYVFPLVAMILLLLTFALVITPIQK